MAEPAKTLRFRESLPGIRGWLWRYGVAATCVAMAFGIRNSLTPLIEYESPFMVFAPAALLAAHVGGVGPGMAALVAGLVLGDYFFSLPIHQWGPYRAPEITLIVTYVLTTAVGVTLFELVARSRRELEAEARETRRRGEELEREVAERKRAEEELQCAQTELSRYADELEQRVADRTAKLQESLQSLESVLYHVAHDLRAPLRAMQGFTTLLVSEHGARLDAKGAEYARRVSEAARRMDDLLRELLNYGRACHIELIPTTIDLDEMIAELLHQSADALQDCKAGVEVQRPLPRVWADRNALEEILTNLLSNALKFVPPDQPPQIEISAEARTPFVRIWMKDQGIGIASDHRKRIFRVFERIDPAQVYPGTGIGLAIVHKLIQRMGGNVGVNSVRGQGSQFWVDLPAAPKRPS